MAREDKLAGQVSLSMRGIILLLIAWPLCIAQSQGQSSQSITLPLSPSALNVFNFGPHSFKVQYPAGSHFSGVDMTVTAVQLTQSAYEQRVAGTQFSSSLCIVYNGESGNCIDYHVTCSNTAGQPIACPSTSTSSISVQTSFDTGQSVTNPGFLTAPIGTDYWNNILDAFSLMRIDPTAHGHTKGFSEFVVVSLGSTNAEGAGALTFNSPLLIQEQRSFPVGASVPVAFTLTSFAHAGQPVTDAVADISVLMVDDARGDPSLNVVLTREAAFTYAGGRYEFTLPSATWPAGTYLLTVFGNAFASQAVLFTIK